MPAATVSSSEPPRTRRLPNVAQNSISSFRIRHTGETKKITPHYRLTSDSFRFPHVFARLMRYFFILIFLVFEDLLGT